MDWEDYPGPELASLYKWRWDGSETALREAKAPLRGAGPRYGADAPLRVPGTGPAGSRGLGGRGRDDPGRRPRCRARRRAREEKGRTAGLPLRPRDLSFALRPPGGPVAIRIGNTCYQAVTSEIGKYRNVVGRDRHRARKSKSPSSFARATAKDTATRIAPASTVSWSTDWSGRMAARACSAGLGAIDEVKVVPRRTWAWTRARREAARPGRAWRWRASWSGARRRWRRWRRWPTCAPCQPPGGWLLLVDVPPSCREPVRPAAVLIDVVRNC